MATPESSSVISPVVPSFSSQTSRSRSSTKIADDVTSLTSFNPFAEEDENEQSSYTLVSSLFSRVKSTLSAPLSSAVAAASTPSPNAISGPAPQLSLSEHRRPSYTGQSHSSGFSRAPDRPFSFATLSAEVAPPLVSLTPAQSEVPTYSLEYDRSPSRGAFYSPIFETGEGVPFAYSIPGFPIQDDARSVKTSSSLQRSGSVSKIMRRLRGEGLSREYWMDDETCKECYYCKSIFTTWRRKHHCRICGQIFCSRCASSIIKGSRFGHDGMIRVCNLCLEKLTKVDEDDDDDRRSVGSSVTSFPAHQRGLDVSYVHRQSPFAASQLFGRTDEPFSLFSIAETKRMPFGHGPAHSSMPPSPRLVERDDGVWEPVQDNPAPFRRPLSDEEKDSGNLMNGFETADSPIPLASGTPDLSIPIHGEGHTSSIQFPMGSPDAGLDSPHRSFELRTRLNSNGDFDPSTPFIRSRVHSRLDSVSLGEPGWRTRRESTAYAQELNLTSMLHLKVMLRQMLTSEKIPNIKEWEETLLKLTLRIAREMTFTSLPPRQGEDMDIRKYVKIKKIPGGAPQDSEYVDGVVITKNVAHKQMSRSQRNPRVMLITFPLEFHRIEGQYMHFGQIVRQEKEYLGNLTARIAALRPHVVLVEQSVSRLALDGLVKNYNIAVARTVKASAIQSVARMTQGDVISSMDKLALEPRLGHCGRFRIRTYDHPLIPGRRKSYMRFEGCSRDMGCTIILRGADVDTLFRIKKVTRFLTFIVRNLKLETHLWKDSVITLPPFNPDAVPTGVTNHYFLASPSVPSAISLFRTSVDDTFTPPSQASITEADDHDMINEEDHIQLTRRIDQSLEAYVKTFISVSATLRFLPPYPLRKMKDLDNELNRTKQEWEDEIIQREESRLTQLGREEMAMPLEVLGDSKHDAEGVADLKAQIDALPSFPHEGPVAGESADQEFLRRKKTSDFAETNSHIVGMQPESATTTEEIRLESKYSLTKWKHDEHRRVWEWYLRKNQDDFVVEKYQCISLWEYVIPMSESGRCQPCFAPHFKYITFYGENDYTLGQFIERSVSETLTQLPDPKAICTGKGCDKPLARHCTIFVHNEIRLSIAVEKWDGQIIGRQAFHPAPELITTWSACRVCGSATPFIPVSEEMQRYSFAKFLELHFYPADVKLVQGAGCQHNIYQHHIRYFACKGMTVRFQTDSVTMHEIVYPPFRIRVRPETQLELKNIEFNRLHARNSMWYSGLIGDLRLISIEAATGNEDADAKLLADINGLILRAESEREDICRLINRIYRESPPTETLALNEVHAYRQDKIVAWQHDFDKLPKPCTSVTERKGSSAFGSGHVIWSRSHITGASSSSASEEKEESANWGNTPGEQVTSSASEVSEPELNDEKPVINKHISPPPIYDAQAETINDRKLLLHDPERRVGDDLPVDGLPASDAESDSTISAAPADVVCQSVAPDEQRIQEDDAAIHRTSKLPRPTSQQPKVAELVKKYQDYLPPNGVQALAETALSPRTPFSESEQEYPSPIRRRQSSRNKNRHHVLTKKPSASDFDQSYAANIAPRYLTRRHVTGQSRSRIPGPIFPSQDSSRHPSPEKIRDPKQSQTRPSSPTNYGKEGRPRFRRHGSYSTRLKDKSQPLRNSSVSKSSFRKSTAVAASRVSTMARHYERIGREAERSRSRYSVIRGRRARPVASANATVEVLDSVKDVMKDESEGSDSSEADDEDEGMEDERNVPQLLLSSPDADMVPPTSTKGSPHNIQVEDSVSNLTTEVEKSESLVTTQAPVDPSPFLSTTDVTKETITPPTSDVEAGTGPERNSLLETISTLWRHSASRMTRDEDPLSDPEHIFRDSSMVVRTDEPTSIIALALNSPQYKEMLAKSRAEKRTAREARLNDSGEVFMPDDRSVPDSVSTWGVVNVEPAGMADPAEDLRAPSSKLPWAISFESCGLTISCTVLYPEQFDALRRTYDCEKSMIECLSRCIKWNNSGGKSGSVFLKTRDDRFIAKELSKPELQTMETFAPAYFDYMSSAVSANRPTLLAKIFGCYKLTFKQMGKDKVSGRSKSTQMNLLVMENLFYDRRFTKIYDLKGSTRNRHVQSTGRENEVLLDENLVESSHLNPFYLREHSKRIMRGALYNDSKFLADINVMDYSLVCGVDSQNNELVVGIVDYIRTYTWDKKLESWVKESAFLGGRGEPTIVTPKQYRQRFISAMERYFPLIPDRWMKIKDAPEEDSNCLLELWPDW